MDERKDNSETVTHDLRACAAAREEAAAARRATVQQSRASTHTQLMHNQQLRKERRQAFRSVRAELVTLRNELRSKLVKIHQEISNARKQRAAGKSAAGTSDNDSAKSAAA